MKLQVYIREAGCGAGNPGVGLADSKFHSIPAVTSARLGARDLQHISQKGKRTQINNLDNVYYILSQFLWHCY